jgi:hypothetical protein
MLTRPRYCEGYRRFLRYLRDNIWKNNSEKLNSKIKSHGLNKQGFSYKYGRVWLKRSYRRKRNTVLYCVQQLNKKKSVEYEFWPNVKSLLL